MPINLKLLAAHFDPTDLEWRIQQAGWKDGKPWAMVLTYVTNRAVMNRLDDVCGPENWQNSYSVQPDQAIECGIAVRCADGWVWKFDAAEATDIEAIKGGRSGAMKRAAVQWGIGRYLYNLDTCFAQCILENPPAQEKQLWHKHYDKTEKKAFFWKIPNLPVWALPGKEK